MKSFLLKIEYDQDKSTYRKFHSDEVTIGSSPFASLHLPDSNKTLHALLQQKDDKFFITKLSSSLKKQKKLVSEIKHNDVIEIDKYKLTLISKEDKALKTLDKTYYQVDKINTEDIDNKLKKYIKISVVSIFVLLTSISFWPISQEEVPEEVPDRFSRLIIDPISVVQPKNNLLAGDDEGEGAKAAGEEGERGDKKAKLISKSVRQIVRTKGVLGALKAKSVRRELASVLDAGVGFGRKFNKALKSGSVGKGSKLALYKGSFGSGMKGIGGGGGGTSKDVVGGLSTKGAGGGLKGYGMGSIGQKASSNIVLDQVNTVVKGSLERSEIEKVIKRHLPQVRYCYERELKANPQLNGKIVTYFVIGGDGSVSASDIKESTMKNSSVETCISRRVAKWIFPKPRGGGIVVVKYPFIFRNVNAK